MRNLYKHIMLSLALFLFCDSMIQAQQLPSSGTWGKGKNIVQDAYGTVTLTGDVEMIGVIRIPEGKTLTITSDGKSNYTIRNKDIGRWFGVNDPNNTTGTQGRSRMFTVKGNDSNGVSGRLIINAPEGTTITLDGGADFTWNNYQLTPDSQKTLSEAIANEGTLELTNVIIQNVNAHNPSPYNNNSEGGAIHISSGAGPTTLTGCTITKCYSELGAAIFTLSPNMVTLQNSTISYCNSGGGIDPNSGGAIRSLGSTKGDLILDNVLFEYNYAQRNKNYNNTLQKDGNGGALFWNGRGTNDTKCVIKSCEFRYNKSDDNGGAIKSQASIEFSASTHNDRKTTIIHHNSAPIGGGLYIEGYTGGVNLGNTTRTINYDLNESLHIYENTSIGYEYNGDYFPGKGAGVHLYFGDNMTLEPKSTINLNMDGAVIENNSTCDQGFGGGIYFENTSLAEKDYTFNIYLNHGSANSNSAMYGGGIYVSNGEVLSTAKAGKTLSVSSNTSGSNGGGIHIQNGSLTMGHGTISSNTISAEGDGAGIYINNGSFTINAGSISNNTITEGHGGGAFIVGGGSFLMNDGSISGNLANTTTSLGDGGGVYITGGDFTMKAGSIADNSAAGNGGGACIVGGGNFTMQGGSITGNGKNAQDVVMTKNGGGVYLNSGNFELEAGEISSNKATTNGGGVFLTGEDCTYILAEGTIKNNEAAKGGGVFLEVGDFILKEGEGSLLQNTATNYGGGVYIANGGEFTMNGGTIKQNTSDKGTEMLGDGGGIYLDGGSFLMNNGLIDQNTARVNGGGVYLNGGSLKVVTGDITSNTASSDGGGFYIVNGEVDMGAGYLLQNTCSGYGGGVYVYNNTADEKSVDFSGGLIYENTALYGGGVCVDGKINLKIEKVVIQGNSAQNGGGVCLMNNAVMNFGDGHIRGNAANQAPDNNTIFNTAYQKGIAEVQGFGGGIYMDSHTTLNFTNKAELGLFGNTASNGGDEIFANGLGTSVSLPYVGDMTGGLSDYPGAQSLQWIEDYATNDPNYDKGSKLRGSAWDASKTNKRYRDMLQESSPQFMILPKEYSSWDNHDKLYVSFALGYEVIHVYIKKYGLASGESAIFKISNGAKTYNIIVTGDGSEVVTKKIALAAGSWTITETGWGWTYNLKDGADADLSTRSITKDIAEESNRTFIFKKAAKADLPMHHEAVKVNQMGL